LTIDTAPAEVLVMLLDKRKASDLTRALPLARVRREVARIK